jgi:hypothetical protein
MAGGGGGGGGRLEISIVTPDVSPVPLPEVSEEVSVVC